MRARVRTRALARAASMILLVVMGLSRASMAAEQRAEQSADARWIPAVSLFSSGLFQDRKGAVESAERGRFQDASAFALWSLALSAELSTPAWSSLPGRPRLFVHADLVALFDPEEAVVNDGDPGFPVILTQRPGGGGLAPLAGVQGRGSSLRVQAEPLAVSAGAGLAFHTDLWERELRIKPSLEWIWQQDRVLALMGEAESEGPNPEFCGPCRTLFINESSKHAFHSLGPGIEFEIDAARLWDFMLTMYTSARAYSVLGDREVESRAVGTWLVDGVPSASRLPSTLTTTYEREAWHYQAGAGVRLRWAPE